MATFGHLLHCKLPQVFRALLELLASINLISGFHTNKLTALAKSHFCAAQLNLQIPLLTTQLAELQGEFAKLYIGVPLIFRKEEQRSSNHEIY